MVGNEIELPNTELPKDNIKIKFTEDNKEVISWSKFIENSFKIFKADIIF